MSCFSSRPPLSFLTLLVFCLSGSACEDVHTPPPGDPPRDFGGPSCILDCYGSSFCTADGLIHTQEYGPRACTSPLPSCPERITYTCLRGCRTDGVTSVLGGLNGADPKSLCQENAPKLAGDPCANDAECQPPSSTGTGAELDRAHLSCDTTTSLCVPAPDPTIADWLAPCGADFSTAFDRMDTALQSGVIDDATCDGGVCLLDEQLTCIANRCSARCEEDWECPDGATCESRYDPTNDGTRPVTYACVPATPPTDC